MVLCLPTHPNTMDTLPRQVPTSTTPACRDATPSLSDINVIWLGLEALTIMRGEDDLPYPVYI